MGNMQITLYKKEPYVIARLKNLRLIALLCKA